MRKLLPALCAVALLAACSRDDAVVEMTSDQRFAPEEITVTAGQQVTFSNVSDEAHTVTAYQEEVPPGALYFASGGATNEETAREALSDGLVEAGGEFVLTLNDPGTYRYFCIPHEEAGMLGTIVVRDA